MMNFCRNHSLNAAIYSLNLIESVEALMLTFVIDDKPSGKGRLTLHDTVRVVTSPQLPNSRATFGS